MWYHEMQVFSVRNTKMYVSIDQMKLENHDDHLNIRNPFYTPLVLSVKTDFPLPPDYSFTYPYHNRLKTLSYFCSMITIADPLELVGQLVSQLVSYLTLTSNDLGRRALKFQDGDTLGLSLSKINSFSRCYWSTKRRHAIYFHNNTASDSRFRKRN